MKIGIVANDLSHQVEHAYALEEGLARHGIETRIYGEGERVAEDTVACWGWRIGEPLRAAAKDVLVLERGYIGDRTQWTSMGWNGLNGRAKFNYGQCSRFVNFERSYRYWNPNGDYVLIVGQVAGDAAVQGVDLRKFYADCSRAAKEFFYLPARFRPHPVAIQFGQRVNVPDAEVSYGSLHHDLEHAAVVVTWNSNTGVDAVMQGKPTIAFDRGSMAWPVTAHDFRIPAEPANRREWAEALAWCQFSLDEIRSGFAWEHVRHGRNSN